MEKSSRPWLIAVFIAAVLMALPSHRARATGPVLTVNSPLTTLDLELAVAVNPFGSTRWARLTVEGAPHVLWLVPARPGAQLDWAINSWLDALDDTTTPRIHPPDDSPPCGLPLTAERAAPWAAAGARMPAKALSVHVAESELRDFLTTHGYAIPDGASSKITAAFTAGDALVAVELDTNNAKLTTPTLRITDDGTATLPLALAGSDDTLMRVTAFVLADSAATLPDAPGFDSAGITWQTDGSTYTSMRSDALSSPAGAWRREAATHDVLWNDLDVPHGEPIVSLVAQYFQDSIPRGTSCVSEAKSAGKSAQTLGRACPLAAQGIVPGGTFSCSPTAGNVKPDALTCGDGYDDLAIALSGLAPAGATLTRFVGVIGQGHFGADMPITKAAVFDSPVKRASIYGACPPPTPDTATAGPTTQTVERPYHYRHDSSGCDGSTTTLIFDDNGEEDTIDNDPGCGGTRTISPTPSTTETEPVGTGGGGGGGGGSSASSSSSTGWDSKDPSGDDSCGSSDSSSSSSSDSCGSDSSSSSSDSCSCSGSESSGGDSCGGSGGGGDGCSGGGGGGGCGDCEVGSGGRARARDKRLHRGPSPISRGALFLVLIALPLRRRTRPK